VVEDGAIPLPAALTDWDYHTVLRLQRTVAVDGIEARRQSGLHSDAELVLTVRWTASGSLLRGRAWQAPVPAGDRVVLEPEFELPGRDLGGVLGLALVLSIVSPGTAPAVVAPTRAGAVLWSDEFSVQLQSEGPAFPMAVADFAELTYPDHASWYLEIQEGLENAAMSALLLVANERNALVVEALSAAGEPSVLHQSVLSVLKADVIRGLVERAVNTEEFDDRVAYPVGSLGAVFAAVLHSHFPDVDLESLRREHRQEPSLFASRLQHAAKMLEVRR
jgi:hypothetical protein